MVGHGLARPLFIEVHHHLNGSLHTAPMVASVAPRTRVLALFTELPRACLLGNGQEHDFSER